MNKLLFDFEAAKKKIYDHVGLVEDWVVYPIDNRLDKHWGIFGDDVKYADSISQFNSDGDYYVDEIYEQCFYDKHIYRGDDFTLIFCDPHVDGMKWWGIFDNKKEVNK